jgi:hypothetical protein
MSRIMDVGRGIATVLIAVLASIIMVPLELFGCIIVFLLPIGIVFGGFLLGMVLGLKACHWSLPERPRKSAFDPRLRLHALAPPVRT